MLSSITVTMPPRPPDLADRKVAAFRGPHTSEPGGESHPGSCDSQGGITIGPERGELGAEKCQSLATGPVHLLLFFIATLDLQSVGVIGQ
jgi:hypothetical protein